MKMTEPKKKKINQFHTSNNNNLNSNIRCNESAEETEHLPQKELNLNESVDMAKGSSIAKVNSKRGRYNSEDDADMPDEDMDEALNSFDNSSMSSSRSCSTNISTSKQSLYSPKMMDDAQKIQNPKERNSRTNHDDSESINFTESNQNGIIYHRPPPKNTNASSLDHLSSGSSDQASDKRYRPQKFCAVCGDRAIACNFNAVTCESCKAFFRRNAFKEKLKCLFEDKCVIDKVTRRFCSRCRLKKCIDIGMKREWILSDEEKFNKKMKIIHNRQNRVHPTSHEGRSTTDPNANADDSRKVEMRDASTSCPDESDLATGEGPGFFYCPHRCQNCDTIMMAKSQGLIDKCSTIASGKSLSTTNQLIGIQVERSNQLTSDNCIPFHYSAMGQRFIDNNNTSSPTNESCTSNSTVQNHFQLINYSESVYIPTYNMIGSMSDTTVSSDRCDSIRSQTTAKIASSSIDETRISGSLSAPKSHSTKKNLISADTPNSGNQTTGSSVQQCYNLFDTGTTTNCNHNSSLVTPRPEVNRSSCDCHPIAYDFDTSNNTNILTESGGKNQETDNCQNHEVLDQSIVVNRGVDVANIIDSVGDTIININTTSMRTALATESPEDLCTIDVGETGADFLIDEYTAKEVAMRNLALIGSQELVILPNNLISYDGGKTMFAPPCATDDQIEARLSSIDLYSHERGKIDELIQAAKFIFEPATETGIVRPRSNDALVDLVQMCDYSLRRFIKTVKQVGAFKILTMDDQITLMKTTCFKILLLRSTHHFDDCIWGWRDSKSRRILSLDVLNKAKRSLVYDKHKNLLMTFDRPLRQDKIIVSLLCMILLFDTSCYPDHILQHRQAIDLEHVNYLCILKKYLICTQPDPLSKYEKLMTTLKLIHSTTDEYNIFFSKDFQPAQITPLIVEIFDIGCI